MAVSALALALMLMRRLRPVHDELAAVECPYTDAEYDVSDSDPRWVLGDALPEPEPDPVNLDWEALFDDEQLELPFISAFVPPSLPDRPDPPPLGETFSDECLLLVSEFKAACAPGTDGSPGINVAAAAEWLIRTAFWPSATKRTMEYRADRRRAALIAYTLVQELADFDGLHDQKRDVLGRVKCLCEMASPSGHSGQYMGVVGRVRLCRPKRCPNGVLRR